jgi:hypothetical protein
MSDRADNHWWLLIHQIPPKPGYLRVKTSRQLQRIGAVAVKNTVYVLPATETAREDFQWVLTQIREGGGEAVVCEVRFVEGLSDGEVRELFRDERDADYAALADEARALAGSHKEGDPDASREALAAGVARLERRLAEIVEIDFFDAPARIPTQALVEELRGRSHEEGPAQTPGVAATSLEDWRGKVWVTRSGVKVDRIASAWLVRRFVDADARFRFVSSKEYAAAPGEARFDMFEAEFTHEGELCTFEVLLQRLGIERRGLRAIAEVVHDIDLKDSKYARPETPGVAAAIAGLVATCAEDEERLARGFVLFDSLLAAFAAAKSS